MRIELSIYSWPEVFWFAYSTSEDTAVYKTEGKQEVRVKRNIIAKRDQH